MSDRRKILSRIEDVLADCYKDRSDAEGFADEAELNSIKVNFEGTPEERWRRILKQAERQGKVPALLDPACRDAPGRTDLASLRDEYLKSPPLLLSSPPDLLRQAIIGAAAVVLLVAVIVVVTRFTGPPSTPPAGPPSPTSAALGTPSGGGGILDPTATPTPSVTPTATTLPPTPTLTPTARPTFAIRPLPSVESPNGMAVDPVTHRIFISSSRENTTEDLLTVLDPVAGTVTTMQVEDGPFGVAINRKTNKLYVANFSSGSLSVFTATSGHWITTVPLTDGGYGQPSYVAINEATNLVYVTLHQRGGLAVIDGDSDEHLKTVWVCNGAFGAAADSNLNRVYVSCRDDRGIVTVDGSTNSVRSVLRAEGERDSEPYALAFDAKADPEGGRLYVSYSPKRSNGLSNPNEVLAYEAREAGLRQEGVPIPVGNGGADGGTGIAVDEETGLVFVTNSQDGTVTVIGRDLKPLKTWSTGAGPGPVAVDPNSGWIYVGNRKAHWIWTQHDSAVKR